MSQTMQSGTATSRPTPTGPIRPRKTWYWVAGVVAVVGLVAGLVVGVLGYLNGLDEYDTFPRLSAPGATEVEVADPGVLVIYHQGAGSTELGDLGVSVVDPSGSEVTVEPYRSELIFATGEGQARAVATFDAVASGTYQVEAVGTAGGHLAVGRSWAWIALPPILGGLAIVGVFFLVGVLIWLITIIRRSNAAARVDQSGGSRRE